MGRQFGDVSVEVGADHVAEVEIHRPPNNFFDVALIRSLAEAYEDLASGGDSRAIVLCAEGKHFCAGADFHQESDAEALPAEGAASLYHEAVRLFRADLPVVAAVQGYCLGFGFELVLMCDIRVAADDAVFALPEAQVGVSVDAGGDLRLATEIGAGHAKLLALTGRRIDAATAERLGIVQQVTTRDALVPAAMAIAADIAANAPLAVQSIKRTIDAFVYRGLPEALKFEALSASVEFVSDDMPAGYAAKAKKQQAEFEGK